MIEGMKERYRIMYASAARALDQPLPIEGGLVQIPAHRETHPRP